MLGATSRHAALRAVIIGAGFTGLAAALDLAQAGLKVTVLEKDDDVGGLAGSFPVGAARLEKFYHHWFTSDSSVFGLIDEIGRTAEIIYRPSNTGAFYANKIFRLSTPLDLLKYKPLSLSGRVRLGLLLLQARAVRDWRKLEDQTAAEWLRAMCGSEVYEKVWLPLLVGKFGAYADEISAVWIWNKLALRGGSRGKRGEEMLAYYRGGFAALADAVRSELVSRGGTIHVNAPAEGICVEAGRVRGVKVGSGIIEADVVLATTPLPNFADLVRSHVSSTYADGLGRIGYLANMCLVMELDRPLSANYWINVADPSFPFVGLIEHTNFEPPQSYGGRHIVYLSKYLSMKDPMYAFDAAAFTDFAVPYIQRMFPEFHREWIRATYLHKADHAQPIVTRNYGQLVPDRRTPVKGLWLSSMAQIYPEDRGTNYAIREGRAVAREILDDIGAGDSVGMAGTA